MANPTPIYHITHVDNLASILAEGGLLSDQEMIDRGGPEVPVGMSTIKQRRLTLPVRCNPGDMVGEYVPFYFCPRSVMLFVLHRGNHVDLTYAGGQDPILHLEAGVEGVVRTANEPGGRFAFSLGNAGAAYAEFRSDLDQLGEVDWKAVEAHDFRLPKIKEGKQAEFLVRRCVPWSSIERIGVRTPEMEQQVLAILAGGNHQPAVTVQRDWYF